MVYYADPLIAGSAHRPQPRPRLLSRWNDLFTSSPIYVVLELLAGISLNATTVVYVSLKIKSISNLAKSGAIVGQIEVNIFRVSIQSVDGLQS